MSYLSQQKRVAFINRRLKYKKDYPSTKILANEYFYENGDLFSAKTFSRDIEWMRNNHAPVEYDKSRKGYFYTDQSFEFNNIEINSDDLLGMMLLDRSLYSYSNSPYHKKMKEVVENLKSVLPDKVSIDSKFLSSNYTVIPEPVATIRKGVWDCIEDSLKKNKTLIFTYRDLDQGMKRYEVDPYHLVSFRGEWYLLGFDHAEQEIRVFAFSRFRKCKVTENTFSIPEDFNPKDYIDPGYGVHLNEEKIKVKIKVYPPLTDIVMERRFHPDQSIRKNRDGTVTVSFTTNQQSQVLYMVAQWGSKAEIIEPKDLRKKAKRYLLDTLNLYYPNLLTDKFDLENLMPGSQSIKPEH
ncbi:MAG: WYL domain-containing protein [Spirochaetota bacterium]|nr:WYL domain-containing protein [Spirochaetota bacterium]